MLMEPAAKNKSKQNGSKKSTKSSTSTSEKLDEDMRDLQITWIAK